MAFEVGQRKERIVVRQRFADRHLCEPLAALYGKRRRSELIRNIHISKSPAVHFQSLAVLLGRVAVALVVSICLDNRRIIKDAHLFLKQILHPGSGNDVRSVLLAGVELDRYFAMQNAAHLLIDLLKTCRGKISCKVDDGLASGPVLIRDIAFAALTGCHSHCHSSLLFWSKDRSALFRSVGRLKFLAPTVRSRKYSSVDDNCHQLNDFVSLVGNTMALSCRADSHVARLHNADHVVVVVLCGTLHNVE